MILLALLFKPDIKNPSNLWLGVTAEFRQRMERHDNPTLNGPKDANRTDLYGRYRVGLTFNDKEMWKGRVEYQNVGDLFWTEKQNSYFQNSDVSLAYGEYDSKNFDALVGRQKVNLGEFRLLGSSEWTNLSRSWDAARLKSGQWDLWGGTLGMANTDTKTVRLADLTHADKTVGTTSLILKHDEAPAAAIDIQTLDHFVKHRFGNTTVTLEGALQSGSNDLKDQRAWAYHMELNQALLKKTTLRLGLNGASGGGNSTTSRTFDSLYPSKHGLYGLADTTGWKNMDHVYFWLDEKPIDPLVIRLGAHAFWLRDPKDAWYSASGPANTRSGGGIFQDPTGKSGRVVGQELDLEAIYSLKRYGEFSAGVGRFLPGDFIRNVGGHSDPETFVYLQYSFKL